MSILIKGAQAVQFYPEKPPQESDILIQDGKIKKIGTNLEKKMKGEAIDKIIDANGRWVVPGNVCAHNHFYSTLARGIIANIPPSHDFVGILQNLWWRLDRALDESSLYYSGIVGALDAVRSGTTSIIDHNASPSFIKGSLAVLKNGFERCGVRGILGYEVTDRNGRKDRDQGIAENVAFIQTQETDMIRGAVGAHAPFTLSDETLSLLSKAVRETKRGIHIHVAEDRYDLSYSHHHFGLSPIERLQHFDLLDEKSLIIHGVHLIEGDIDILRQKGSFLVHNPKSNMNNNVGYNGNLFRLDNVAIGTDGIGSDMFEEVKFGYFKSRDAGLGLLPTDFMRFLYNGNRIIERYFDGKFGRIEPGYTADLVILDYANPTPVTDQNVAGHFVFGLNSVSVQTVIINGQPVYENRRFPFATQPLYEKAREEASKLWKEIERY